MNVFITGMTGTGKSYFVQKKLLNKVKYPIYAFSNKIEDYKQLKRVTRKKFYIVKVYEGREVYNLPDKNIFFNYSFITQEGKITFIDTFAHVVMQLQNRVIYIDEAHEVLANYGKYSKILEAAIAGGRARGLHFIVISQRPQNIKKSVINNCKWIVSFKLNEPKSIESIIKHMQNVSFEELKNLPLYHAYIYNAYTGKLSQF